VPASGVGSNNSLTLYYKEKIMNWFNKIRSLFQTEKKVSIDYSTLKVVELKVIAEEKGLKGYSKLRKAELVEALKASV
jgi:hypothetical protein